MLQVPPLCSHNHSSFILLPLVHLVSNYFQFDLFIIVKMKSFTLALRTTLKIPFHFSYKNTMNLFLVAQTRELTFKCSFFIFKVYGS